MMSNSSKKLEDLSEGYTHVDTALPEKDGVYDVIYHCGSMSISYKKMQSNFRKGKFTRWDWDYVVMWK